MSINQLKDHFSNDHNPEVGKQIPAKSISVSSQMSRSHLLATPIASLQTHPPAPTTFSSEPASVKTRTQASWVELLRFRTRSNEFREAILAYNEMACSGVLPDNFAFPAVLKAATALRNLNLGKQIQAHVVKFGYESSSVPVANSLLNMYGNCGDILDVYKVFDRIPDRDQVSWNSFISALCRFEEWEIALEAFRMMFEDNVEPSSFTLVSAALACSNLPRPQGLRLGKQVHGYSLRTGDGKTFTNNAIISLYAKLGRVDAAKAQFELFEGRDLVSWNTLLSSLSQTDQFLDALFLIERMVLEGVKPDAVTITSVLPACSHLELLDVGKQVHAYALRNDILTDNSFVGSALVDMYCNCRKVESGRRVFDCLTDRRTGLWNAMITGYAQNTHDEEALMLFIEMEEASGLLPNATTMASVIPACLRCEAFTGKEEIHGYVVKRGLDNNHYVQNALMDMYSRMGKIEISRYIFDSMEVRDLVSWNTMMTGYVVCGLHDYALFLVHEMQRVEDGKHKSNHESVGVKKVSFKPNSITLMTVLPGCATLAALAKGREIHAYAIRHMLASDIAVGSALVDMYAKCGCVTIARKVFDQMPFRNVITWNVMIMGYGMHGQVSEAVELFNVMLVEAASGNEIKPNAITFIAIFAACSHSGKVDKGLDIFYRMKDDYGVELTPDHFSCIVDLLGRAGRVEEAYGIIKTMPSEFDKAGSWSSLLGSCRIHKNVEIGEIAAEELFQLEPNVASHYVLLSNIYSSAQLWDKATEIRRKMTEVGVRKEPGCSWIEFGDKVHKFVAGDASHPQSESLRNFLETLSEKMRKAGHVPDTSCVLHNVTEDEKETLLCGHSEKLAIAFGILNSPPGTTIRVAKNLRVCNDCHEASKYISKILEREIILRDVRRFHHFRNGTCSCGDYW